ncbi:MAG TPA: glutathione peroxidase [Saprospirales bacterium]|nr:glutathione peroxidase [Saprospirales bacterium]
MKRLIRLFFQPVLILWALWSTGALKHLFKKTKPEDIDFYNLEANLIDGLSITMDQFRGKTVIVVNTASKCGFTPQYEGLEHLYRRYKDQGLMILGFPCNQFGNQETADLKEIESFCKVNYDISFPLFEKTEVNGNQAHPVFKFLKAHLGTWIGSSIKWNFTKFVIDKNGKPVKRFGPHVKPAKMEKYIKSIL